MKQKETRLEFKLDQKDKDIGQMKQKVYEYKKILDSKD